MRLFKIILLLAVLTTACTPRYSLVDYTVQSKLEVDSTYKVDNTAEATIASYRGMLDKQMNRKIGVAAIDLYSSRVMGESILGNFAADLLQERSNFYSKDSVDMSIQNFGGLRVNINKGDIYVRTIYELMPFDNLIVIMKLKGSTINKLFEYQGTTKSIAISNTQLRFTKDGRLKEAIINGEKFDPNKTYTISTSDYLANGGGNMIFLKEALQRTDTNILLRNAMIEYIEQLTKQGKAITAKIESRVVFEEN